MHKTNTRSAFEVLTGPSFLVRLGYLASLVRQCAQSYVENEKPPAMVRRMLPTTGNTGEKKPLLAEKGDEKWEVGYKPLSGVSGTLVAQGTPPAG
jgi:hypothetical protein